MDMQTKITKLSKDIRGAENLKLQAETRLETLTVQYKEINESLIERGVDPKNAAAEIENMEKDMIELESRINELLPHDLLEQYRATN